MNHKKSPDYLFEVSWEVCNKVGGIHTVIATKAKGCVEQYGDQYICVGPDVWRSTHDNPEFVEDPELFADWRQAAQLAGLHVRIGRWQVVGNPIVFLIDFTPYIDQKDEILATFWDDYRLDSLTGQWDYIEPALFGFGVGKVLEHFTDFYISPQESIVAHFQEWMTGTGLLYLKKNIPRVSHVFTCHATVLGRTIAGVGQDLYGKLAEIDPELKAQELYVQAKYSLEKIAAREADVFTTVSEITAEECKYLLGREVDLITPNGFELDFVPAEDEFEEKRQISRKRLIKVGEAVLGTRLPDDIFLVGISGRYEFRNKGIDIFIEVLGDLESKSDYKKNILALILIPAYQHGPKNRVLMNLEGRGETLEPGSEASRYLTHYLVQSEHDPVINRLIATGLHNDPDNNIKVIFIPSYLDGKDGIVNLSYYDTLIGLDYTVFPSYYEPWGYTPLESLAFHIPTVTTDLAGFGKWIEEYYTNPHPGAEVLKRLGEKDETIVTKIQQTIRYFTDLDKSEQNKIRENAFDVSKVALWEHQFQFYNAAYQKAIDQLSHRHKAIIEQLHSSASEGFISYDIKVNTPIWSQVIVKSNVPEGLESLEKLSKNLWWSWDPASRRLFNSIDPKVWKNTSYNPVELLQNVSFERLRELTGEESFRQALDEVLVRFHDYMALEEQQDKSRLIAYFSMEYGLDASLKLYSGGLGVLAGDYLKQASDDNIPMVAIGLFYRYGYFTQTISAAGQQIATYDHQNFTMSAAEPVRTEDGMWESISISFPGRTVKARIWKVDVGKTSLYLLDTDFEENEEQDRSLTHHLYGGGSEHRMKQEILLGIGGIRLLKQLDIKPAIYHLNEGHAAFAGLERLYYYIDRNNLSFDQARVIVRSTTLFTTHTPVPAGHDVFDESLIRMYLSYLPERLKIEWDHFIHLGQISDEQDHGRFSMSVLACRLAQEINGVSRVHGSVSQEMFAGLFPGYFPEENHITYVTNGVHYGTWTSDEWRAVLEEAPGKGLPRWDVINEMSDQAIWSIRQKLRNRFSNFILDRSRNKSIIEFENPSYIREVQRKINPNSLFIGFARRFATYKRATLLFRDLDRLERIVNEPDKPVTFVFAGKAHPRDIAGQDLIKRVVQISKLPAFLGKVIFLQNYDMDLAKSMVSGVDIWLNNPTRPLEASGTSGQKVVMNGGLHLSVLDGWWVEGYLPDAGWALPFERTFLDQEMQDELDADHIYTLLEGEIKEAFFSRDEQDVPVQWTNFIRKSMTQIAPRFTSHRMINDYQDKFYNPLIDRGKEMIKDRFAKARHFIHWKKKILDNWDNLRVIEHEKIKMEKNQIIAGHEYRRKLVLDPNGISVENIGVELVIGESRNESFHILKQVPYNLISDSDGQLVYELQFEPVLPGIFEISTRIFIKNDHMPYRSDLPFVRWI